MKLQILEILKFGDCSTSSSNFVEGEKVLNSNHMLACVKLPTTSNITIKIQAYCLQSSDLEGFPHELKGEINTTGSIKYFQCSCEAGLSEKCKHILAVLLYCNRHDTDNLEVLSCTDMKYILSKPHKKTLEQYKAIRVQDHECYKKNYKGCNNIKLSELQIVKIKELLRNFGDNTLTKHM